jgi:hypothetical protein
VPSAFSMPFLAIFKKPLKGQLLFQGERRWLRHASTEDRPCLLVQHAQYQSGCITSSPRKIPTIVLFGLGESGVVRGIESSYEWNRTSGSLLHYPVQALYQ